MNTLPRIYCDLDETLVDFYTGVDSVLTKFEYPLWRDEFWNSVSENERDNLRWSIIKKEPNFWANLPWLKDGKRLWNYIEKYNPHICSHATAHMDNSHSGKVEWIKRELSINTNERINIVKNRADKSLYALSDGKQNLLIDDYIKNCNEFVAAGGIAILHINATKTISELIELGF